MNKSKTITSLIMIFFPIYVIAISVIYDPQKSGSISLVLIQSNIIVMYGIIVLGLIAFFNKKKGHLIPFYGMIFTYVACIAIEIDLMTAYSFLALAIGYGIANKISLASIQYILILSVVYYSLNTFKMSNFDEIYVGKMMLYFVFALMTYIIIGDINGRHRK